MREIPDWPVILTGFVLGYILGSVPFGYLFGCLKGIDLRRHGSGNIGATNAFRFLGKGWGVATFILDFLKAPAAVWVAGLMVDHVMVFPIVVGAVVGHNYPVWLGFRGGKGIATSAGGLLIWMPKSFGVVLAVWAASFAVSRYVSLASILSALALPVATWFFYPEQTLWIGLSVFLSALALWRHRENIQRLMKGAEYRFDKKTRDSTDPPGGAA